MEHELRALGLTEGESKVYLALLKLGSTTVGPLVKHSGVSYSKIYAVLDRLLHKGLASYNQQEKTRYYQAATPTRLLELAEAQKRALEKNTSALRSMMPSLQAIRDERVVQSVEVYTGLKGIKTAYEMLTREARKGEELRYFYVYDATHASIAEQIYDQVFHLFRKTRLRLRGVAALSFRKSKHYAKPPAFIDLRFVDFPLPGTIDIFGDKILQLAWGETPTAILIHSKEIADNYRAYFEEVWKKAKKRGTEK